MSAPARPGGPAGPAVPVGGGPVEGGLEHEPDRGVAASRGGRVRPARAGLLAVGLVVALAAVATTALAVVSLLVRQDTPGAAEVRDVTAVRVENRCGDDVELTGLGDADSGRVTVAWDDAWSLGRPRHSQALEAGRLVVRVECPTVAVGVGSASRLRVRVPGAVPVEVSAGSGDADLGAVEPPRDLVAATGSGDALVGVARDPSSPLRMTLRTGAGDVDVMAGPPATR